MLGGRQRTAAALRLCQDNNGIGGQAKPLATGPNSSTAGRLRKTPIFPGGDFNQPSANSNLAAGSRRDRGPPPAQTQVSLHALRSCFVTTRLIDCFAARCVLI